MQTATTTSGDRPYRLVLLLGRALMRLLGLRRRVRGAEHLQIPGGAVLAITHFGYLDFALAEWAIWHATGRLARFLVTARAFGHPLAGPLLRGMRHIPVDRRDGAQAYQHAVRALQAGELVGIFPEGQVNQDDVGPIKTGAVRMAAQAGVPIIPIVVWGAQEVLTKGRRFGLRRALGSRIIISIGLPIHVGDGSPGANTPAPGPDAAEPQIDAQTASLLVVLRSMVRESKDLMSPRSDRKVANRARTR
jgi:1-acyl-sn-glycerol-3-phosphate acyltransferase